MSCGRGLGGEAVGFCFGGLYGEVVLVYLGGCGMCCGKRFYSVAWCVCDLKEEGGRKGGMGLASCPFITGVGGARVSSYDSGSDASRGHTTLCD